MFIGTCTDNKFLCSAPSNVCLNKDLVCDGIESCIGDEINCTSNDSTVKIPINDDSHAAVTRTNVLIGMLIICILILLLIVSIIIYGRRKKKWREFLAQLDNNNTDWEYEQLDDGPSISASRPSMTPIFNMNVTTATATVAHQNSNSNAASSSVVHYHVSKLNNEHGNSHLENGVKFSVADAANGNADVSLIPNTNNNSPRNFINERTPINLNT